MASSFVQFRTEESIRIQAANILDDAGETKGLSAMKAASRIAEGNGISDMAVDEINAEVAEARKQRP